MATPSKQIKNRQRRWKWRTKNCSNTNQEDLLGGKTAAASKIHTKIKIKETDWIIKMYCMLVGCYNVIIMCVCGCRCKSVFVFIQY